MFFRASSAFELRELREPRDRRAKVLWHVTKAEEVVPWQLQMAHGSRALAKSWIVLNLLAESTGKYISTIFHVDSFNQPQAS